MDDTNRLIEQLRSPDEEVRRQAVKALGDSLERGHLLALVEAMGDPSWRVRKEAALAVLTFDDPGLPALLLEGLRDGANAGRRNSVVETLIRLGPRVIPEVVRLLTDPDPDVRKFSVDILGGMDTSEVVPPLTSALEDADSNVAAAAAEYLGTKGDRGIVPALLRLLDKSDFWLRFSALRAIGQLAGEEQEEVVLRLCEDPSLRFEAIEVLARVGGKTSFTRLLDWYPRWGGQERNRILEALSGILFRKYAGSEAAAQLLVVALDSSGLRAEFDGFLVRTVREGEGEGEAKRRAIRLAGIVPSAGVMEALVGIIEFSDEEEREDISRALMRFPAAYLPALFPYLGSESTLVRRKIIWIFGHHRYQPALPRLLPLTRDDDGHVRAAVAVSLGKIGDTSAIMSLCNLLDDPYPDVRQAAVEALTEMSTGDEVTRGMIRQIIATSLESGEERVIEGSLLVLGNLVDSSFIPIYARFLKDARGPVRKAALLGLGRLKDGDALDLIATALTDEDPDIRIEVIRHLGQNGGENYAAAIMAMVDDEEQVVAAEALRYLGRLGGEQSRAILGRAARESAGLRQLAALRALSVLGGEGEWAILAELLPGAAPEARREIITSAGRTGDRTKLSLVLPALQDADWSVRLAAVEAVGRLGDPETIALVKTRYHSGEKDPLVRRAMESLPLPGA